MDFVNHLKRNCECCGGSYATGKDYGYYSCELPIRDEDGNVVPPKGLCEFCNPNDKVWYNHSPNHHKESCRKVELPTLNLQNK